MGVTNPKTIAFFVAVLPQFVDYSAGGIPWQLAELGLVFVVLALICDSCWALAAGTARAWFANSPKRIARLRATGGGMMIGLGGVLPSTSRRCSASTTDAQPELGELPRDPSPPSTAAVVDVHLDRLESAISQITSR